MADSTRGETARRRDEQSTSEWVGDIALTVALGIATCFPHALVVWMGIPVPLRYGHPALVLFSALLFVAPLVLRRHSPLFMLACVTLAGVLQLVVSSLPMLTVVVVPLYVYSVARWVPGWEARLAVAVGLLGSVLGPARWLFTWNPISSPLVAEFMLAAVMCAGSVLTPYSVGRRARETDEYEQSELERARRDYEARLLQQQERARTAEVRARNEIARELHDVVAHSLSVIIVQAQGGQALAAKKPEAAAEVLGTIAATGRDALADMRRIVGVLRSDPRHDAADFLPAPGLADVADLVEKTGVRAHLRVDGTEPAVSTSIALTVYRIVQEALTNVLKHAGPDAHAWVTLTYHHAAIEVEVRDNGLGSDADTSDGTGNGLRGMAERVTAMGGTLEASPVATGGYLVHAVLPTDSGGE